MCPRPRTTESMLKFCFVSPIVTNTSLSAKQCYHCQGLGHVQADCPTLRISGGPAGGRCYSCGLIGHLARNCPTPNPGGPPRGAGRGGFPPYRGGYNVTNNRAATCYKCGGPNHYARDCQAQAMKCYACGKLVCHSIALGAYPTTNSFQGHISRDCTAPNGGPLNAAGKTCYKCREPGHISKDCTNVEANGTAPVVPNGTAPDVAAPAPAADTKDIAVAAAPTAAVA